MNALIRKALVVLILVPLAASVFGLRFACDSRDVRKIMREALRNEELEQSRQVTYRRIDARQEVVRKLIAQECSLKEALASFQELDHEWPDYITELSKTHERNCSDVEESYRYIVSIAKGLLEKRPEEAIEILQRLEKDYQQMRAGPPIPQAEKAGRAESLTK